MSTPTVQSKSPAEVAGTVLDAIEAHPEAFDMSGWFEGPVRLEPGGNLCGATMCIAGWAAHVTGWTLVYDSSGVWFEDDNGERDRFRHYAVKGDMQRTIWSVAGEALGLEPPGRDVLFQAPEYEALDELRWLAGR